MPKRERLFESGMGSGVGQGLWLGLLLGLVYGLGLYAHPETFCCRTLEYRKNKDNAVELAVLRTLEDTGEKTRLGFKG